MADRTRHFACTQCGKCCNRAPEVELSEAAALADHFVFRLLFRVYNQPANPPPGSAEERAAFFERKRLLKAFSARSWPVRSRNARGQSWTRYLVLSALAMDGGSGACPALVNNRCGIWPDRPLTCRSVPLHYSVPDSAMIPRFDALVATPGFECDTSNDAPLLIHDAKLADPAIADARARAAELTGAEARWKQAIIAQMRPGQAHSGSLPTREQIDQHAPTHALTAPMATAWQIAADIGIVNAAAVASLLARQVDCIDRELATESWNSVERQTLSEMRADYAETLGGPGGDQR